MATRSYHRFAGNKPRFTGESLSANPQIFRGRFASVLHFFIAHLGTLIQVAQAGSFNCYWLSCWPDALATG